MHGYDIGPNNRPPPPSQQSGDMPGGPPPPFNALHPHPHQQQQQPPHGQPHGQPQHPQQPSVAAPSQHFVGSMEQHPMDSSDSFVPLMESDDSCGPE